MIINKRKMIIILIICSLIFVGFSGTGIFYKEYIYERGTSNEAVFKDEEKIKIAKTNRDSYLIERDDLYYKVPKDALIRISRSTNNYKVVANTPILDKPNGVELRILFNGEILELQSVDGEFGIFKTTTDNIMGAVNLGDLEVCVEESLSYGISKVDKTLKNKDSYYVLVKGEMVAIKNYVDGNFIIVDSSNNEFQVDKSFIEIRQTDETVSRSSISRKTKSITKLISTAFSLIGKPYIYGDVGKRGFDCSGLTYYLYLSQLGIELPRSSHDQVNAGVKVEKTKLVPGDLLFFNTTGRRISHVGIYIGDGDMIHASTSKSKVKIDNINTGYYNQRYVTARRIIN
ncbi:C40 family peptidase [Tissierella sp. Yu-01]|uniref:C40 family peptidase n=1 Tax=Tissierella sp. Yu-01 TaxID=3035694 RepID=UPI00240D5EC0|nr:C40 family peptidase [Tissierella sp. Yu-01]WFA09596.1 C40 family peptidase [Tissierella sp. Yu-01]